MKILIVEDDLDNSGLVECILKNSEHTVSVVGDRVEALEKLRCARFNVLLIGLMIPQMDGVTLT
jgi:DNA-binding response OmpR family regulator